MAVLRVLAALLMTMIAVACPQAGPEKKPDGSDLMEHARRLAQEILIVDTHIDLPERLSDGMEDISVRTPGGNFDYVRAKAGGLKVPFMAVFISSSLEGTGKAKARAEELIAMVESFPARWPDKFTLVRSVADVTRLAPSGKIMIAMGMENGSALEGDLANVRYFYGRGIRYITLAHARSNHICDSSYDPKRQWNGLSPFGKQLIAEMNRVGMMIDVSHVSDSTFYQVIRLSKAPVIASHSSCRAFTPGFERNLSDEMISALAQAGGVIQINFGSDFLRDDIRRGPEEENRALKKFLGERGLTKEDPKATEFLDAYRKEHPQQYADVSDVARHIDHVAKLAGIDHVGLGSDFDGVGDSLPTGLKDVSGYPNVIAELLKLGYSDDDIRKVCGENLMRVWREVERGK